MKDKKWFDWCWMYWDGIERTVYNDGYEADMSHCIEPLGWVS